MQNGILHEVSRDNFGVKADMLGLSLEKQVEQLNRLYKDKLIFGIDEDIWTVREEDRKTGIVVRNVLCDCHQLVLPSTSKYCMSSLIDAFSARNLTSIVVPSIVKEIKFKDCRWIGGLDRLFVYDTTELDFNGYSKGILDSINMVIVRPLNKLQKPKIYRL